MKLGSLSTVLDSFQSEFDSQYKQSKEELSNFCEIASIGSLTILASSVILRVAQQGLTPSDSIISDLFFASTCYLAYNSYQISENFKDFARNPKKYMTLSGFGDKLDEDKFRDRLTRGTFCFNWATDKIIDSFKAHQII